MSLGTSWINLPNVFVVDWVVTNVKDLTPSGETTIFYSFFFLFMGKRKGWEGIGMVQ